MSTETGTNRALKDRITDGRTLLKGSLVGFLTLFWLFGLSAALLPPAKGVGFLIGLTFGYYVVYRIVKYIGRKILNKFELLERPG